MVGHVMLYSIVQLQDSTVYYFINCIIGSDVTVELQTAADANLAFFVSPTYIWQHCTTHVIASAWTDSTNIPAKFLVRHIRVLRKNAA